MLPTPPGGDSLSAQSSKAIQSIVGIIKKTLLKELYEGFPNIQVNHVNDHDNTNRRNTLLDLI